MRLNLILNVSLALVAVLLPVTNSYAATITVDTFADELTTNGNCTLREAVISANMDIQMDACTAGSGDDTIVLAAGTYILSKLCSWETDSLSAQSDSSPECDDLDIYSNITVVGAGKGLTIVTVQTELNETTAQGTVGTYLEFRAFDVHTQGSGSALSAQDVCQGGCALGNTLTLNDLTIEGASDTNGGAVKVETNAECQYSRLATSNVAFKENAASNNGGAIHAYGQVSLANTTFDDNIASDNGGAVYLNWDDSCTVTNSITSSIFDSNTAFDNSGGALFADTDTTVEIANSTFQNNHATISGGAISSNIGSMTINDSSIANNGLAGDTEVMRTPNFGGGIAVGVFEYARVESLNSSAIQAANSDYSGQDGTITLLIQNSTIKNNQARFSGGGIASASNNTFDDDSLGLGEGLIVVNANVRSTVIEDNFVEFQSWNPTPPSSLDVVVTAPYVYDAFSGGGIWNESLGRFEIETSTISANLADFGGGIANLGDMKIQKSTINGNISEVSRVAAGSVPSAQVEVPTEYVYAIVQSGGAGIYNKGSLDINNSTISGNKTDSSGAGLLNRTSFDYAEIYKVISDGPSDDEAKLSIFDLNPGYPGATLNNVTITKNEITIFDAFIPAIEQQSPVIINNGGGIAALSGRVTISNTAVAANKDDFALVEIAQFQSLADSSEVFGDFAPDCYVFSTQPSETCQAPGLICEYLVPAIVSRQHNLIGNNLGCTAFQPATNTKNDIVGTPDAIENPLLSDLANNGGTTLTHLPNKGSKMIDKGSVVSIGAAIEAVVDEPCQPDDQRVLSRPIDGNNDGVAVCDIGAVEVRVDCDSVPGGTKVVDACGVCGGDGSTCVNVQVDCAGTPNGTKVKDACGVCGGDGSSCKELTCKEEKIVNSLIVLDGSAHDLANLTNTLVRTVSNATGKNSKANKKLKAESNALLNQAWTNTWNIPQLIKSDCTGGASVKCATVSNEPLKAKYTETINQLYQLNETLIKQLNRIKKIKAKSKTRFQSLNDQYLATALTTANSVPSSTVSCS